MESFTYVYPASRGGAPTRGRAHRTMDGDLRAGRKARTGSAVLELPQRAHSWTSQKVPERARDRSPGPWRLCVPYQPVAEVVFKV